MNEPLSREYKKLLMIPVSHSIYKTMKIVCYAMLYISLLLFIYTGRCFVLLLLEIARGKAFTVKNYRRLFYIAGIIALFPITSLVTQVILQWSYRSYYAGDLLPDFDWGNKISWMLAALVVFLLALAFRKGYRMQQEQELTI